MPRTFNRVKQTAGVAGTALTLTALGYSAAQIAGARKLEICPADGDLMYDIGAAPTATEGIPVKEDEPIMINDPVCQEVQVISQSGTVNTTFYLTTAIDT